MNSPFRITSISAALAAAGLLAAGIAVANPRGGGMLERMDADKDGAISKVEMDAHHAEMAAALDANADGQVTFEESKAHRERQREERARAYFARQDANGDGKVSVAEIAARHDEHFAKMDTDADGKLSKDEMRAGHRMHRGGRGMRRDHGGDHGTAHEGHADDAQGG